MESERLIYRELLNEDLQDFYEIFSSDNVDKFVRKMTMEDAVRYFEKRKTKPTNPFSFAVALKETGKVIGTCGIKIKEKDGETFGEISYVFNDKFWNRGYCTEACRFVIKYFFENSDINLLKADCVDTNFASIKILSEKLGMRFVEHIADYGVDHHDENKKVGFNFYEMTRSEFEKSMT